MRLRHTALAAMAVFSATTAEVAAQVQTDRASPKDTIRMDIPHYRENKKAYSCFDKYAIETVLNTTQPGDNVPLLYVYRMYETGKYEPANICKATEEDVYKYALAPENQHKAPIRVNQGRGQPCMIIWSDDYKAYGLDKEKNMRSYMDILQQQERSIHRKQLENVADTAITVTPNGGQLPQWAVMQP